MNPRRIAVLCVDPVGAVMSSPSIRACELGRVLRSAGADVHVYAPEVRQPEALDLPSTAFDRRRGLAEALDGVDVVLTQPQWPTLMRELRRSGKRLIFDLYYPDLLEKLERPSEDEGLKRRLRLAVTLDRFNEAMRIGHNFICGSERQLDLWLGSMMGLGYIHSAVYGRDSTLRSVIDVVPFGLPREPAETGPSPWGRFKGIEMGDEVVLWNGGIWPWLDALTAVRAVAELAVRRPRVRLVFMAIAPGDLEDGPAAEAHALALKLGVLNTNVFFNTGWVPYEERGPWLTTAACGLLCHGAGLEARFSVHSRVLDSYWAGLPFVSTDGDVFSSEIEREGLGAVAPAGDAARVAAAIEMVLERGRESHAADIARVAERYRWEAAAEPLVRYALAEGPARPLGGNRRRPAVSALRSGLYRAVEAASRLRGDSADPA